MSVSPCVALMTVPEKMISAGKTAMVSNYQALFCDIVPSGLCIWYNSRCPHMERETIMQMIHSQSDLSSLVEACGFLPFFRSAVPGFSVEEHTPSDLWFADGVEGPWEWKGPVIRETGCAYGKFFQGKAGFITREWYLDFANYRRDGYDFDARCDEGLMRYQDKLVYSVLEENGSLVSRQWRELSGIKNRGEFDSPVGRLQMLGYVMTSDFEYSLTKDGVPYGWGLSRYTTPELLFGEDFSSHVYQRSPEASKERIERYLKDLLPGATARQLSRIIG